jgi:hypothetical protein
LVLALALLLVGMMGELLGGVGVAQAVVAERIGVPPGIEPLALGLLRVALDLGPPAGGREEVAELGGERGAAR